MVMEEEVVEMVEAAVEAGVEVAVLEHQVQQECGQRRETD